MSHYYWDSLRKSLNRDIKSAAADRAFAKIKRGHEELADFVFPADVVAFLWNAGGDYERSNTVLAALVLAAQQRPEPVLARNMLWLSLWPGLDAAYRRICRHRCERPVEVAAALSTAFAELVARQSLDRVTQVAATLVRSSTRDAINALRKERGYHEGPLRRRLDLDLDDLQAPASFEQQCADFSEYLRALGDMEGELAIEVFLMSETRATAGERFGLAEAASHKRLMRAIRRLRSEIGHDDVQNTGPECLPLLPDDAIGPGKAGRATYRERVIRQQASTAERQFRDDEQHVAEDGRARQAARSAGRVVATAAE